MRKALLESWRGDLLPCRSPSGRGKSAGAREPQSQSCGRPQPRRRVLRTLACRLRWRLSLAVAAASAAGLGMAAGDASDEELDSEDLDYALDASCTNCTGHTFDGFCQVSASATQPQGHCALSAQHEPLPALSLVSWALALCYNLFHAVVSAWLAAWSLSYRCVSMPGRVICRLACCSEVGFVLCGFETGMAHLANLAQDCGTTQSTMRRSSAAWPGGASRQRGRQLA